MADENQLLEVQKMNDQLKSIRHALNFIVVAIVFRFIAFVWSVAEFYE